MGPRPPPGIHPHLHQEITPSPRTLACRGPFRAATGCEVVQVRMLDRYDAIGLRPWIPNRERMDPRGNPLTPKTSCEELEPPANPARFSYRWPSFMALFQFAAADRQAMTITTISDPSSSQDKMSAEPSPIRADRSPAMLAAPSAIGQRKTCHRLLFLAGRDGTRFMPGSPAPRPSPVLPVAARLVCVSDRSTGRPRCRGLRSPRYQAAPR